MPEDDTVVVVLVGGARFAGKDTVGKRLIEETNWNHTSFAKGIKVDCAAKYGLDFDRLMSDQAYKDANREVLIKHGADRRVEEKDYWARRVFESLDHSKPTVVTDFRFPNEHTFLASRCVLTVTVLVVASEKVRRQRGWVHNPAVENDVSERSLDDWAWDVTIYNEGPNEPDVSEVIALVNSRRLLWTGGSPVK